MEISRQHSLKEYVLKCSICYELYSNLHKPLVIPCGHTICSLCLKQLKKMGEDDDEGGYRSDLSRESDEFDASLESSENPEEDEEEAEDNENDEDEESEDNTDSENGNNNTDEEDVGGWSDIVVQNPSEEVKENQSEKKDKKCKIQCPICKKKMRLFDKEILPNQSVMSVIQIIDNSSTSTPSLDLKVFCKVCRVIDTENNHLEQTKSHYHREFLIYLNDEEFVPLKKAETNKYLDDDINKKLANNLKLFFEKLLKSQEYKNSKEVFKTHHIINSEFHYIKHKSFKKLTKLYSDYTNLIEEKNIKKAEVCLKSTEKLLDNYLKSTEECKVVLTKIIDQFSKEGPLKQRLDKMISTLVRDTSLQILNYGFLEVNRNGLSQIDRRFSANINGHSIEIYDNRIDLVVKLSLKTVFKNFNEKRVQDNGDDSRIYLPNYVEIDSEGKTLFLLGKESGTSKKFFIYNLETRELVKMKSLPSHFGSPDIFYHNKRLYVLGGSSDSDEPISDCYYFNLEKDEWEDLPELNIDRYSKSIAIWENKLYVFGGYFSETEASLTNEFEILDLSKLPDTKWTRQSVKFLTNPISTSFYGFLNPKIFVIMGGEDIYDNETHMKGYLVDMEKFTVIEEFTLKSELVCYNQICSNFRGFFSGSSNDEEHFSKIDLRKNFSKLKTTI